MPRALSVPPGQAVRHESVNPPGISTGHSSARIHTVKINLSQGVLPMGFMLCFWIQSFRNAKLFYRGWALRAPFLCWIAAKGGTGLW